MSNILDYVRTYGTETMLERHFCSADALVLAQLSYIDWESAVPGMKDNKDFITLKDTMYQGDVEKMVKGSVFKEENRALFFQAAASRRFSEIKINFYTEIINEERNLQMAAMTFLLPCGRACVTFRGTDDTLNGWKENFSMVYRFPVPAQEYAAAYLYHVSKRLDCPLIVCGHSKGGNLAVYASAKCGEEVQGRIRRIYNFDGPGFWDAFMEGQDYARVALRIRKYVAPESFIGLLLRDDSNTFMVKCNAHGMLQHDPYNWEMYKGRLRKVQKYNQDKRVAGQNLNHKIMSLSKDRAQLVIESFFEAVKRSGLCRLSELNNDYALEVLRNFHENYVYDRDSLMVLARLLLYLIPGRKILRQ